MRNKIATIIEIAIMKKMSCGMGRAEYLVKLDGWGNETFRGVEFLPEESDFLRSPTLLMSSE